MSDPNDICPECGTALAPSLAHGIGVGDTGNGLPRVQYEEQDCPGCGIELKRKLGGPWSRPKED